MLLEDNEKSLYKYNLFFSFQLYFMESQGNEDGREKEDSPSRQNSC
jgi:hypothetical protein